LKNIIVHWDDEKWSETGFHRVVNNGGNDKWKIHVKRGYKKANRVADGIFHLGLYKTLDQKKILNEDWNRNVRWRLISRSLSDILKDDLNIKSWSPKAYYRAEVKKIRAEMLEKIKQVKTKKERKAIKAEYKNKKWELWVQKRNVK